MDQFFSVEGITRLVSVPQGGRVHIIGVCGVAMAPLAIELSRRGYRVSGSDKEFCEPMGTLLSDSPVTLSRGYDASCIPENADLVVIGNTASYENPEVQGAERRGLPFTCFPVLLHELIIGNRHSIVVAGTHGKSTTTAVISSALITAGKDPSSFVGALPLDAESGIRFGQGEFSVVEGDEYHSAFFARTPKFHFYSPRSLVVTSIEFDHADIFPDLDAIRSEFTRLVESLPSDGTVYACIDDPVVKDCVPRWSTLRRVVSYGTDLLAEYRIEATTPTSEGQSITWGHGGESHTFSTRLMGLHNARNAVSCVAVLRRCGLSVEEVHRGIASFQGIARRQHVRFSSDNLILIDDFAHHPTAVRETIDAIKSSYPTHRLVVAFEPRSTTSRRRHFQESYSTAFYRADEVFISAVELRGDDTPESVLDTLALVSSLRSNSVTAHHATSPDDILADLTTRYVVHQSDTPTIIAVLSNGAFGNLTIRLEEALRAAGGRGMRYGNARVAASE